MLCDKMLCDQGFVRWHGQFSLAWAMANKLKYWSCMHNFFYSPDVFIAYFNLWIIEKLFWDMSSSDLSILKKLKIIFTRFKKIWNKLWTLSMICLTSMQNRNAKFLLLCARQKWQYLIFLFIWICDNYIYTFIIFS
jgi:hypothetical protein